MVLSHPAAAFRYLLCSDLSLFKWTDGAESESELESESSLILSLNLSRFTLAMLESNRYYLIAALISPGGSYEPVQGQPLGCREHEIMIRFDRRPNIEHAPQWPSGMSQLRRR